MRRRDPGTGWRAPGLRLSSGELGRWADGLYATLDWFEIGYQRMYIAVGDVLAQGG